MDYINIDILNHNSEFLYKFDIRKFFISACNIVVLLIEFYSNDAGGKASTWGKVHPIFSFLSLNNVQIFFILVLLGNFLIALTSFPVFKSSDRLLFNKKQIQLFGLLVFLTGILSYFDFLFFEPFVLLYLCIVAFIYYGLVTGYSFKLFNFSFSFHAPLLYQKNYNEYYNIAQLSIWNQNTRTFLNNFYTAQKIDILLLILIAMFFVQLAILFTEKNDLIPQSYINAVEKLFKKSITLNSLSFHKYLIGLTFILFQYLLIVIFVLDKDYFLTLVTLSIAIPLLFRKILKIELVQLYYVHFKIYDLYIFNILIILTITYVFGPLVGPIGIFIDFIISLWVAIKISSKIREFRSRNKIEKNPVALYYITIPKIISTAYVIIILLFICAWATGNNESLYFLLLFYFTILRFSPFIYGTLLNPGILKYIFRRLLLIIPMFIGISIIVFGVLRFVDFNLGYQTPWIHWFFHFISGDFGEEGSIGSLPIALDVARKLQPSLEISVIPSIIALSLSLFLGILAYKKQYSIIDDLILIFVSIGLSIPVFVFILVIILIMSYYLVIFPAFGRSLLQGSPYVHSLYVKLYYNGIPILFKLKFQGITFFTVKIPAIALKGFFVWSNYDWFFHIFLPVSSIAILGLAVYTRLVRSGMIDIMNSDYVLSARASGFSENYIIYKVALRNAILPVVTFFGLALGALLSGAPITEYVIAWPGLGLFAVKALKGQDYASFVAASMVFAIMILLGNLVTDIAYGVIDPRVRLE